MDAAQATQRDITESSVTTGEFNPYATNNRSFTPDPAVRPLLPSWIIFISMKSL